jgi:hypothetical protein
MAMPLSTDPRLRMPPMWEVTYYQFMYGEYHRRRQALPPKERRAASLLPPPPWLVAIAGVM